MVDLNQNISDTAGDDINTIKNQINSLLFVKKVCDSRIQWLQSGKVSKILLN